MEPDVLLVPKHSYSLWILQEKMYLALENGNEYVLLDWGQKIYGNFYIPFEQFQKAPLIIYKTYLQKSEQKGFRLVYIKK